tara:strand:+ start:2481 stop:2651 length:171 start_codon:yes stop_codon:yes gene_type:complete
MAGIEPGTDREYWLNCLAEYQLALTEEFQMEGGYGFNDEMIQLLKFEIEQCLQQLA